MSTYYVIRRITDDKTIMDTNDYEIRCYFLSRVYITDSSDNYSILTKSFLLEFLEFLNNKIRDDYKELDKLALKAIATDDTDQKEDYYDDIATQVRGIMSKKRIVFSNMKERIKDDPDDAQYYIYEC